MEILRQGSEVERGQLKARELRIGNPAYTHKAGRPLDGPSPGPRLAVGEAFLYQPAFDFFQNPPKKP